MLRADVQKHEIRAVAARLHAPIFGPKSHRFLLGFLLFVGKLNGPISVARAGWSFESGCPTHVLGIRIRSICGWPWKRIPNMSQTSRSYQFAAGQISVTVSMGGWPALGHFDPKVPVPVKRQEVVHDGEVAGRLPFAVDPHTLVDRR